MQVGLAQAVELTGKHASTITRAVQAGKLSATMGPDGQRQYDVAELERWAGQLRTPGANGNAHADELQRNDMHMVELAAKEAEVAGLRELLRAKDEMIADLKADRERWQEQAGQITRLLTDQRDKAAKERERREAAERAVAEGQGRRPGFLGRLFGAGA